MLGTMLLVAGFIVLCGFVFVLWSPAARRFSRAEPEVFTARMATTAAACSAFGAIVSALVGYTVYHEQAVFWRAQIGAHAVLSLHATNDPNIGDDAPGWVALNSGVTNASVNDVEHLTVKYKLRDGYGWPDIIG